MNQKIVVFKDKILWSYDENPIGIVFKNNQTIDLFSDPDNDHTLPPAPPVIKRQTATALGAADRTGVNLFIHREGLDRKDRVVSNYNQEIKISLGASGSCTVTAWRQFGDVYSTPVSSQFRQGSCRVRFGFVDLPR